MSPGADEHERPSDGSGLEYPPPRAVSASPEPSNTATILRLSITCVVWFGLWGLTPGLLDHGPVRLFVHDDVTVILLETLLAMTLLIGIVLVQRRRVASLLAPSRQLLLYAIPVVLAAAVPLHYHYGLPVGLYLLWITVSVVWQDTLTFGLLQSHLGERLRARVLIPTVALLFYLGHALLIPDRFAPAQVLPSVGIIVLGLVLALLRRRLGTLHLILALHLSFYFVFT